MTTLARMLTRPAATASLALLLTACSSASTDAENTTPVGPPSFTLVAPTDGSCRAIGSDVTARVPIEFATNNVVLRPPGACASFPNCGIIELRADGLANDQGASLVVDLLLGKLASPYRDGELHQGTGQPNLLPVEASLVTESGSVMLDAEGLPLTLAFKLAIKPSCE